MALLALIIGFLSFEGVQTDGIGPVNPQDVQMAIAGGAHVSKWKGLSSSWSEPTNWDSGIPDESTDVILSVGSITGKIDPIVPAPFNSSPASVRNLTVQSGGKLTFAPNPNPGLLVIHGSEKLQNDGRINLGNGKIVFKNKITFMQGGTLDAGSGTLEFEGVIWDNKAGSVFNAGTSTVILNGPTDQTILGNIIFHNLEVATAGTVTLSGSITVTNRLTIEEGSTLNVPSGSTLSIEGSVQNNGEISGSGTVLVQGQPLPVQLSAFSANASLTGVELRWRTETETNNYGFEIQRRLLGDEVHSTLRGTAWQKVALVQGAGTSTSPKEYTYFDGGLKSGRYVYRIKQIDSDGTFSIYHTIEVEVGIVPKELKLFQNYPNPFNPSTVIAFSVPTDGRAVLKVYDVTGRMIETLFDGVVSAGRLYQVSFDARQLASGIYLYGLSAGDHRVVRRMAYLK